MNDHINALNALSEQITAILDLVQGCDSSTDIKSVHSAAEMCITMMMEIDKEVESIWEEYKEEHEDDDLL